MMAYSDGTNMVVLLIIFATLFLYLKTKRAPGSPYPPGPRKYPLIQNLLDFPTSFEWETYARWGKEYDSDVIHLRAAGHDVIVLNSFRAAVDLLEKKSAIYSSRPQFTMVTELMGWKWFLPTMVYGKPWKERRRVFQKYFSNRNIDVYQATQLEFVRKMLPKLLESPAEFYNIAQHMTGGLTISLAYGLNIQDTNDPIVGLATRAVDSVSRAGIPGAFLVDFMPWLKYIPEWVPGAGFQKTATAWRKLQEDVREIPFMEAAKNFELGIANPSFVSDSLENLNESENRGHQLEVIKDMAGGIFATGSDTTLSSIHTLFVAILYAPDVQRKAQEELDRVLGGRLPEFSDQPKLPYITALVKEILRWKPVTPLGVPHYADEDNVHDGYLIPKGALVIANSWAMLQNEEHYPMPHIFSPERFLKEDGQLNTAVHDPALMVFGFGRRLCPGRHVATSLIWITIASILSTFEISREVDKDGTPLEPSVKYHSGLLHNPLPFRCTIKPRSKHSEDLIRSAGKFC